ncbi:Mannose-6-phosphate isomerase [Coemansia sp. RSA 1972]|nr:Mannose-6-phosphate isomerase [Coemansia sp. RSA 1972]
MSAIRLSCAVNNYHWGKHGLASKAAQFAATNPDVTIDEEQTYAELWMGTHPNGPSMVYGTDTQLSDVISENAEVALGASVSQRYAGNLPFLFKVLSIEKALSIQAHPDKQLAQQLHATRPGDYKDGNHKPEMSIALTDFIALSGFRPLAEIAAFLDVYPEFSALVPGAAPEFHRAAASGTDGERRAALKALFAELMMARSEDVRKQVETLVARIGEPSCNGTSGLDVSEAALVRRLNGEYPGDVGIFCVFMLNVLRLQAGDAFYMGPNDPHAYIYGDCVECMATSDNVVRAGLTPKQRDVQVLVDMLTYDYGAPSHKLMQPQHINSVHAVYNPPIDEFSVVRSSVNAGERADLEEIDGPRILLVVEGTGTLCVGADSMPLGPGFVYFVCPSTVCTLSADTALVAYTAQCE